MTRSTVLPRSTSKQILTSRAQADTNEFLARHINDVVQFWPRRERGRTSGVSNRSSPRPMHSLRVLVVGELSLCVPVSFEGTKRDLENESRLHIADLHRPWTIGEPDIGGFAAAAARAAAALGAQVSIR